MAARGGNLECTLGRNLAMDVAQARFFERGWFVALLQGPGRVIRERHSVHQVLDHGIEIGGTAHFDPRGAAGEGERVERNDHFPDSHRTKRENAGQGSSRCAESSVQCKLPDEATSGCLTGIQRLSRGREHGDGDREIQPGPLLAAFSRCQIHGHASVGKGQARCRDRPPDA